VIDSSRSASKLLVSASDDKSMLLWDTESGQCLHKFGFGCMNVSVIASSFICFICDGFFLSCCGNKLQLWHIPSGKCAKIYETPSLSLAVARLDDDKFVTGSDKILSLWNLFLS
jgi:WD40 repeat protein